MGEEGVAEIKEFVDRLRREIGDLKAIFFGSRARGDYLKSSDFDLILISEKFKGMHFLERIRLIYEFWDKKEHLDVFCYTEEEFEKKKNEIGTVKKALEEGIML